MKATNRLERKPTIDVIASSNLNPKYFDCVEIFIKTWLNFSEKSPFFEFIPRVFLISDSLPQNLVHYRDYITLFPPLEGIPDAFAAQNIRLLATQFSASEFCMLSDIDMLPLNIEYFQTLANYASSGKLVIGRGNLLQSEIPICYNISSPFLFRRLVDLKATSLSGQMREIWDIFLRRYSLYDSKHGGTGWSFDQEFLYAQTKTFPGDDLVFLDDIALRFDRLDRDSRLFKINEVRSDLISNRYTDFHIPLPSNRYSSYIELVLNEFKLNNKHDYFLLFRFFLKIPFFLLISFWPRVIWKLKMIKSDK